jgi:hypothetical protein
MKAMCFGMAAAVGLALSAGPLYAQYSPAVRPPGVPAPVYSPYLNLLRSNNPAWLNYYGLVRPEVEFRSGIYGLQQGVETNTAGISALDAAAAGMPLTGHSTAFLNTSHYFLNRGGVGTPAAAPGAPVVAPGAARATINQPGTPAAPARRY